jgi:hypothetical protein
MNVEIGRTHYVQCYFICNPGYGVILGTGVILGVILGTVCTSKGDSSAHVEKNISKCRLSYFNLVKVGLCHPSLNSCSKVQFLFQSSLVAYCMCAHPVTWSGRSTARFERYKNIGVYGSPPRVVWLNGFLA